MKPRDTQITMAEQGFGVLKEHAIVYLAAEERTGKTITSLLIAEKCLPVNSVLILTKKKAIDDWMKTLKAVTFLTKDYAVNNYHQAKHEVACYDLIILDEAHNYISAAPKPSAIWKEVKKLTKEIPLIYISATPHAQGRQQLYHQFALSDWSPWAKFKTFYKWFKTYGIPTSIWISGQQRPVYTNTQAQMIIEDTEHLFVTKTRKDLGFAHEPTDKLHYIELDQSTKDLYNVLVKDRLVPIKDKMLVADTPMKLRTSLHMLEGGVAKIEDDHITLANQEKINYIKSTWGDTNNIAIFYQYIEEGNKLRKHFRYAKILQGTSYAEGIDLSDIKHLVIYSQDFSTARHTQRRARQANFNRDQEIIVNFLLCENAISEQVYNIVSVNKQNFVDSVFNKVTI